MIDVEKIVTVYVQDTNGIAVIYRHYFFYVEWLIYGSLFNSLNELFMSHLRL